MMELGVNLEYLLKQRGTKQPRDFEQAAELCKSAGFAHVDFSSDYVHEDYAEIAAKQRGILDAKGISVDQTHAPFNRYHTYPEDQFQTYCMRSLQVSKILGAKYVVVHADEYRVTDHYNVKEILDYTYDYLAPYVDYAAKNGMKVAIENVFEDGCGKSSEGKSRFTSRVEEIEQLIERLHSPEVGLCWDFGHACCSFGKDGMLSALKQVGKYLCCTHVHDNYYGKDLHLMPFLGDIDWESHMRYLASSSYDGNLSFEFVYGGIPDSMLLPCLTLAHRTGETLLAMAAKES